MPCASRTSTGIYNQQLISEKSPCPMMHDLPRLPSCDGEDVDTGPVTPSLAFILQSCTVCPKESASQMCHLFLCLAQSETVFAALELLIIILALLHWYGPHLLSHLVRRLRLSSLGSTSRFRAVSHSYRGQLPQ